MPLPTLSVPRYPLTIPSTKKLTTFRPFLVKEQKILLMALESEDEKQIIRAMLDIVTNCVDGVQEPESIPLFDLEYIFAKIRAKSVGEQIDVKIKCSNCDKRFDTTIDVENLEVKFPEGVTNKIMLSESLGMVLRYPAVKDMGKTVENMNTLEILNYIADSIEMIFDADGIYTSKDFTHEEAVKFVESLSSPQFEKVSNFYKTMPQLEKDIKYRCPHCNTESTTTFRGLRDFFT